MDPLKNKYTYFQRLRHQWQRRRDIPFRKKFFVGYDLHGNTYWEFTIDGNMQRLRRKLEPYKTLLFQADYFGTVPPQWLQWLRRTRNTPPTLEELINDQIRQQKIKILAQNADEKWTLEKLRLEREQQLKLQAELDRVEQENQAFASKYNKETDPWKQADQKEDQTNLASDPWKQADQTKDVDPIESAALKPRK
ncbi:uncharacterized protein CANTADRAFT_53324 [Suhomyces tanzawaensis NRRL Y-17324]|uniref:NADH dehydrogenase [ubiquinone] 1 alpha subcomplex subunit n=1 Tax=Suhomyces tanzawaensis NRRL Y-17324 TaxID=984487 RepID=A0A1E4SGJ2_9ASCO|nr:uncharacterized protein CANTADRAFT_53324 [Suhomyces tanzawaensis NRRL Y-17324]ODV78631.1 hypothetical protein CANTADRAFT_53324 [Suhomyces tanzawaensis NRRL Y-17324]